MGADVNKTGTAKTLNADIRPIRFGLNFDVHIRKLWKRAQDLTKNKILSISTSNKDISLQK